MMDEVSGGSRKGPKVLLLGWEFPPVFSGGLGIVTRDLFQGLQEAGADVKLILPFFVAKQIFEPHTDDPSDILVTQKHTLRTTNILETHWVEDARVSYVETMISHPYVASNQAYEATYERAQAHHTTSEHRTTTHERETGHHIVKGHKKNTTKKVYGDNLWREIDRFAHEVLATTHDHEYDLVHAQDWITAEAAIQMKVHRGIPFVMHVHATQVDRMGHRNVTNDPIFKREQYAMEEAEKIVAVSGYTKQILIDVYGIAADKIEVLHNVYTHQPTLSVEGMEKLWPKNKKQFWVLFIGRLTLQKGPEYFLEAAKKVLERTKRIHFFVAGHGDMYGTIVEYIAKYHLHENVHMVGFITPEQRDALYRFTDCCVIPSVSEPFGLTLIEAAHHNTPLVVSKNCGANEVIGHKLETDFWDSDAMAEYILALQHYPPLRRVLRQKAKESLPTYQWKDQAQVLMLLWERVLAHHKK